MFGIKTMPRKILIMGLPGSGKTTLARQLAPLMKAVHWNADDVRSNINKDLGFSMEDRIEQARRMGWLCDNVSKAGHSVIADFVCPIPETRAAFGSCTLIYMDTIKEGRFEDTNKLFVPPTNYDFKFTDYNAVGQARMLFDQWSKFNVGQ